MKTFHGERTAIQSFWSTTLKIWVVQSLFLVVVCQNISDPIFFTSMEMSLRALSLKFLTWAQKLWSLSKKDFLGSHSYCDTAHSNSRTSIIHDSVIYKWNHTFIVQILLHTNASPPPPPPKKKKKKKKILFFFFF